MPVVLSPLAVAYVWKFIFQFNGPLNGFLGLHRPRGAAEGVARRPDLGDLGDPDHRGLAADRLRHGHLPGRPGQRPGGGRGGRRARRRRDLGRGSGTSPSRPSAPSIAIATTLGIIQGLRVFDQILALTGGGPAGATETLATQVYKQAFALGKFGFGAALALVLTVIILAFAILQQYVTRDRDARRA